MAFVNALSRVSTTARKCARFSSRRLLHHTNARRAVTNMRMPAMSPTMTEGGIASWKKKEGESFSAGDVLLEIETDKATIDVEAQDDGILGKILAPDGAKNVQVGKLIALLAEEGDDISNLEVPKEEESTPKQQTTSPPPTPQAVPEPTTPSPSSQPHSSGSKSHSQPIFPSVHRLLAEYNIDIDKIVGTGVRGMLTKGDVLAYLGKASGPLGTFKQSPTPIEEATKVLRKKEEPKPLDGAAIRQIIVSTMLQDSIKARSVPLTSEDVDFDTIIADYLPPQPPTVSKQPVLTPPQSKITSDFLDGLI